MEKGYRVGRFKLLVTLCVLPVAMTFVLSSQGLGATQGSLTCSSCHAFPPLDSNTRNRVTGGIPGNHQTHVKSSPARESDCARCHVSTGFTSGHRDGKITFQSSLNNSPSISQYRVGGRAVLFRNQTSVSSPGSCANINCHFENATPAWGSTKYQTSSDCSGCHTVPGNSSGHAKHNQYYPALGGCSKCHPDWATGLKFSHATSATSRGIKVILYEGNYSGTGSNFLPSQYGNRSFGTCFNLYCHSDGKASPTYAPAAWGSSLPADCSGCHGNAGSGTLSGRHSSHVNNDAFLGKNFSCAECHARTVSASSDTAISDRTRHVNRFIEYSGARAGRNGKDCSNIYCHSDGKGNGADPGSWTGGPAITNCKGCHGARTVAQGAAFDSVAGEPNYASDSGGGYRANSHLKHVGAGGASACDACHSLTTTSGTAIAGGSVRHINGVIDITLNPSKAGGSAVWAAGKTCNNIACHSGRSAQWGQPGNCDLCHPAASLKGAHSKHLAGITPPFYSYTGNHSYGDDTAGKYEFGCSNCHPLINGNHMNGQILLDFRPVVQGQNVGSLRSRNRSTITTAGVAGIAGGTDPSSVPGSRVVCLNLYCHSNGYGASAVYATTPDWYGGTFTGDRCASCHGNSPGVTTAGSAAHAAHVVGIHWEDVFSGNVGKLATGSSGSVSHGIEGQSSTMNCNTCHFLTVTSARNDRNSACVGCHGAGAGLGRIANRASHVNGVVEVSFGDTIFLSKAQLRQGSFSVYSAAGGYWDRNGGNYKNGAISFDFTRQNLSGGRWNAGSCSNVACHMNRSVNWNDTGVDCENCHSAL